MIYDGNARPQVSGSPHGAFTWYTYTNSPPTKTATTNGHWEKTTYDGLGRPIWVEMGDGVGVKSTVDTEYDACGCSPIGKVKRVSQPFVTGSPTAWTVSSYDGLGRVVSVTHAGGTGTTGYVYEGNTVTVTDPKGKWKKYESDVFGNLVKVTEPDPGPPAVNVDTLYTYNLAGKLRTVTMARGATTQTRTFVYDAQQRLQTVTLPETGTTTYGYNVDSSLAWKVDAKNQRLEYGYDTYKRVTQIRRYPVNGGAQDTCQQVNVSYDWNPYAGGGAWSENAVGRVAAVQWGHETACAQGRWTEMYSYTVGGNVNKKRLRLGRLNGFSQVTNADLDATYGYNNEGQMTAMGHPGYYTGVPGANAWVNGAAFTIGYDGMARMNRLTETTPLPNFHHISSMGYGAAGQITSIGYGTGHTQTRQYNARLQLTRMTVAGVMDVEYTFAATQNNGQIEKMKNWISGEEVSYQYDSLKRLTSAVTTGPEWGLSFVYDGFGNRTSQTVTKGSGPVSSLGVNPANNRVTGWGYDANGNTTSQPGAFTSLGYDVDNRLVSAALAGGGSESYGYGPDNKRVWRVKAGSGQAEIYFHGVSGQLQGVYKWDTVNANGDIGFYVVGLEPVIPKGLQMNRDRLGSVLYSTGARYYP